MNDKKVIDIKREDIYLLILFSVLSLTVYFNSFFDGNGFLNSDSACYLALAQNLLERNSFFLYAYRQSGGAREFFALWPIGYPTFIYLTAKITGLSAFWAAKLFNIFTIFLILALFRALFKRNAYIYGLIFFFSSYLDIFSYTWSETIFIFGLVWFATAVYLLLTETKNKTVIYTSLLLSTLLLFLTRYIGAFSFGLVGLLGLYYGFVKKEMAKAAVLISIACFNIAVMAGYLYHNTLETGFPTGTERIPSTDTHFELFIDFIKAVFTETIIPVSLLKMASWKIHLLIILLQFCLLSYLIWRNRVSIAASYRESRQNKSVTIPLVFASIGFIYLYFITVMRWLSQFVEYRSRLLGPGSFLLFIALIAYLEKYGSKKVFNEFKMFLLFVALLSWFLNVPYKIWTQSDQPVYRETIQAIEKKYADIKPDSIIIFAPIHLRYLRTDLQSQDPFIYPNQGFREKWPDFIQRVNPAGQYSVYLAAPVKKIPMEKMHATVVEQLNKVQGQALTQIE